MGRTVWQPWGTPARWPPGGHRAITARTMSRRTLHTLRRLLVRATFWPTLAFNRLMCLLGIWRPFDEVDPHVVLGALPSKAMLRKLRRLGVTGVINCCDEYCGDAAALSELGLEQLHLPTLDYHSPGAEHVRQALAFIDRHARTGGRVYIHCKAGRGRSATLALCYLIARRGLTPEQAYAELKRIRPHIDRGLARRKVVREMHAAVHGDVGT